MNLYIISTPNLKLIAANRTLLHAAKESDEVLANLLNVSTTANWNTFGKEIFDYVLTKLEDVEENYWLSYFIVHQNDAVLIGTGGYKGKPDEDNSVEIGYEIAEAYQGRGFATEAAQALVDHAFEKSFIQTVKAHTLAFKNASTRVLEKCGLEKTGELVDPEDGAIWSWAIQKKK